MNAFLYRVVLSFCLLIPLFSIQGAELNRFKRELSQEMEQLQRIIRTGNVDFATRRDFDETLGSTTWNLSRVFAAAESVDWGHPSPARLKLSQQAAETIAPYNALLYSVAFSDDVPSSMQAECLSLLKYSKPDPTLSRTLRNQLASGSLEHAGPAADLLFEYRSLNDEDKQNVARRFSEVRDRSIRAGWVIRVSTFGMSEAVSLLGRMLEVPLPSEKPKAGSSNGTPDGPLSDYRAAAEAIDYLGQKAKVLRPLLEQRLSEINRDMEEAERRIYAPQLQGAIDAVDGRRPVQIPVALNASGLLTQTSATNPPTGSGEWVQQPGSSGSGTSELFKTAVIRLKVGNGDATMNPWPWVWGLFLAFLTGVIIVKLRA